MFVRSGLVASLVLFALVSMSVTLGMSNGYDATSVDDARIDPGVREEIMTNLSKPQEPEPNPLVPDRFESSEPQKPPEWLLPLMVSLTDMLLTATSAIGVWTYRNLWWLPAAETMQGVLNFVGSVYLAMVGWISLRKWRRLKREVGP